MVVFQVVRTDQYGYPSVEAVYSNLAGAVRYVMGRWAGFPGYHLDPSEKNQTQQGLVILAGSYQEYADGDEFEGECQISITTIEVRD